MRCTTTLLVAVSTLAAPVDIQPLHAHDCECCQFLGWADGPEPDSDHVDVYFCQEGGREPEGTLILRTGEQGDYSSMPLGIARQIPGADYRAAVALYERWRAQGSQAEWRGLALRTA